MSKRNPMIAVKDKMAKRIMKNKPLMAWLTSKRKIMVYRNGELVYK